MKPKNNIAEFPVPLPGRDHHILIPDDAYEAEYVGSLGFLYLGTSPRVALCFTVTTGETPEQQIFAYYKVLSLLKDGNPVRSTDRVRSPSFRIGWKSRLARDLGTLYPEFSPQNLPTAIPTIDRPVLIQTATVREDRDGAKRPEAFWCSKVDRIVGWAGSFEAEGQ